MKTVARDLPERLWLSNSLTRTRYALRFDRKLSLEQEVLLGPGDSEVVLPGDGVTAGLSIMVCDAALVGRPYVEAESLPRGKVELLADGSRVWSGRIWSKPVDFKLSRRKDECHFGAMDFETSEKEIGLFVPNGTIFKLAFRGVSGAVGAVPARVKIGVELAVYTTRVGRSKSL